MIRAATIVLVALLAACSPPTSPPGGVEVRVANESSVDFDFVSVGFPGGAIDFGSVAAGGFSPYRRVERAYAYTAVTVLAGGAAVTLQPIDYVGERPLHAGRHTYALGLTPGIDGPTLVLRYER
jgi:hypothetical protein